MCAILGPRALVLVGGHSRGVGKTQLIEQWLRARRGERWIAVKVSAHRHAADGADAPLIEEAYDPTPTSQTGRYLSAGAARAFLVRAPETALRRAADFIAALRAGSARAREQGSVIVESNRLARFLNADALFFVVDPEVDDWKPSSADCLCVPHVIVCQQRGPRHDSHIVTSTVGDGAALGTDSLHRVGLSRGAAHGVPRADRAG